MVYVKWFSGAMGVILLLVVAYGDLETLKAFGAGICGAFVVVVVAQESSHRRIRVLEEQVASLRNGEPGSHLTPADHNPGDR